MADDESLPQDGNGVNRIPPYISFNRFLVVLENFKVDGIPSQINATVLDKSCGKGRTHMMAALRSLNLVDGRTPTRKMVRMVNALGTPEFRDVLAERLRSIYPYLFRLDLMTATPTMLDEAFMATGAKILTAQNCRTFFLHAVVSANIPLGVNLIPVESRRWLLGAPFRTVGKKQNARPAVSKKPLENGEKPLEYCLVDLMAAAAGEPEVLDAIVQIIAFVKTKDVSSATETMAA